MLRPAVPATRRGDFIISSLAGVRSAAAGSRPPRRTPPGATSSRNTSIAAGLGPVGLGVNRRMRHDTFVLVFFVPDPAVGQQNRTVDGDSSTIGGRRLDQRYQIAPQTADRAGMWPTAFRRRSQVRCVG